MSTPTSVPTMESHSPHAPSHRVAKFEAVRAQEVPGAADAARQAQTAWWASGASTRANALSDLAVLLRERRSDVQQLIVEEVGKPSDEAKGEVSRAVSICNYYAQRAYAPSGDTFPSSMPGRLFTERRPRGVAGIITPWNFPVAIPLWKAVPALAVGNAVLLKPSPEATATARWLAETASSVLPADLLQVLPGEATTGSALVAVSDVVSFTGSEQVGRSVVTAAAVRGIPVQAEMGGQNAAIVLEDADVEAAARQIAPAAMAFAGQKCTATRRVIVVGGQARRREVRDALVSAVSAMRVGDPSIDGVSVGPLISEQARDRALTFVDRAISAGAQVVVGGRALPQPGWYFEPTLIEDLPPDHELACEELFGPVAAIFEAGDVDEAVDLAEGTRYGLVTSVHGRDAAALLDVACRLSTGMIKVNAPTTGVDFYAPFGGEGDSSYGPREQGEVGPEFYTSVHTVTFAPHA